MTLRFDGNGCCMVHSVMRDGGKEIVTNKDYFVMSWKMVNVDERVVSLAEAVDEIFS